MQNFVKNQVNKLNLFKEKHSTKINKVKKLFDLRKRNNILSILGKVVMYAVLIVLSYIVISPLIDVISKSFMSQEDLINQEVFYLPNNFTFNNYIVSTKVLNLWKALFNSIWFSGLLAVIQTLISAVTAYAFARYNFKGKKILFGLLILAFIIPSQVLIVTRIALFTWMQTNFKIKFMNTLLPNILVTIFGQGVYSTILILIFYNFFKQIPYDLDEAAYMDGANAPQVLWHVIIKLSLPVILTVFLFSFVWNWNESVMTNNFIKTCLELVPQKLAAFDSLFTSFESSGATDLNEGYKMAGTLLSILPLIVLYIFVQRKFIEGIEQTGITGV